DLAVFGDVGPFEVERLYADGAVVFDHEVVLGRAARVGRIAARAEEVEPAVGVADAEALTGGVGFPGESCPVFQFHGPLPAVRSPRRPAGDAEPVRRTIDADAEISVRFQEQAVVVPRQVDSPYRATLDEEAETKVTAQIAHSGILAAGHVGERKRWCLRSDQYVVDGYAR